MVIPFTAGSDKFRDIFKLGSHTYTSQIALRFKNCNGTKIDKKKASNF